MKSKTKFDPKVIQATLTRVSINDGRLRRSWPTGLTRVELRVHSDTGKADYEFTFSSL